MAGIGRSLLPDCPPGQAERIAERLQQKALPFGQTCSIGVASWRRGDSPADLLTRADRAMHEAKQGRALF
jgi:GGDEF domain-containing protein